jgi:hypothetical protein
MKLCPSCNKPAKLSFSYKNMYVCRCLGVVEDISIIKQKMIPQSHSLLFGHINFVPQSKEVLGSIIGANGLIYHFDTDQYPFSLGSFVRFKPENMTCENTTFEVSCAKNLEIVTPID